MPAWIAEDSAMQNTVKMPDLFRTREARRRKNLPAPDSRIARAASPNAPAVRIRPYRASDRRQVQDIAWLTGDMGRPAARYWAHRESFANLWTSYYTDCEPEHLLVAESAESDGHFDGRVIGYLAGCVDSRRAPDPSTEFLQQVLRHALWVRPGTAAFCWRAVADVLLSGSPLLHELHDPRWPAHLHIDLLPDSRGHGIGQRLMDCWLNVLRARRVPGCYLITLAENRSAIAFFTRCGFRPHGKQQPVPGLRSSAGARLHAMTMVIDL